jgi:hypothetical protein
MESDKTGMDRLMSEDAERDLKHSQSVQPNYIKPQKHWEEKVIINNLYKIEAIDKRMQELEEKIRENRFAIMSILAWEIELERLSHKKERLIKKNDKLYKALKKKPPLLQLHYPKFHIRDNQKINQNIKYAPIILPSVSPYTKDLQLEEVEDLLNKVYEQKNDLYMQIQDSATGIADPEISKKLDEIIRFEATLMSKAEDIRLSIEAEKYQSLKHTSMEKKTKEEKNLDEIQNIREENEDKEKEDFDYLHLDENEIDKDENEELDLDEYERETFDEIQDARDGRENDKDEMDLNDGRDANEEDFGRN